MDPQADIRTECMFFQKRRFLTLNRTNTTTFEFTPGFEGVPEMLGLNVVASVIIILIFSVLRKKACHYGRLALLHQKRSTLSKFIFGYNIFLRIMHSFNNVTTVRIDLKKQKEKALNKSRSTDQEDHVISTGSSVGPSQLSMTKSTSSSPKKVLKTAKLVPSPGSTSPESLVEKSVLVNSLPSSPKTQEVSSLGEYLEPKPKFVEKSEDQSPGSSKSSKKSKTDLTKFLEEDHGIFGWIRIIFLLSDEHIRRKCGLDSVYYAMFQRRLIAYMLIITVLGVSILLPIHLTGNTVKGPLYFAKTSIANLPEKSNLVWFHCFVLIGFNVICIFFLRAFAKILPTTKQELMMASIMIRGLNKNILGNNTLIQNYFTEAYPKYKVINVTFAYDVRKLMACEVKLKNAVGALKAATKEYKKKRRMRASRFSKKKILCTEYYENQVEKYEKQLLELKAISEKSPLPICFVTFEEINQILRIIKDFERTRCGPVMLVDRTLKKTAYDSIVKPNEWTVTKAPDPDDIQWENLSVRYWYIRGFVANVAAFFLAFFFTTPATVLIALLKLNDVLKMKWDILVYRMNFVVEEGIPILLLIIFACLLPYLLSYAEYLCCHKTKSYENLMVIRKVTIFLLFMVLILPSLSISSARTFAEMFFSADNSTEKWGCIFLPQNGAFFTSYIISSMWVTVAMEFLRLSGLINYGIRRLFSRSKFERFHATWSTVWAFPFGDNYAWMLLIFSIVIVYGIFFPLILPAGFGYFLFKYYADRYNMFFAYLPGKISTKQHFAAMNFILFSFLLSQFVLFLYLLLHTSSLKSFTTLFMLLVFMFSTIGFIWHSIYGWIWYRATNDTLSVTSSTGAIDVNYTTEGG